jgi:ribosomal protein L29
MSRLRPGSIVAAICTAGVALWYAGSSSYLEAFVSGTSATNPVFQARDVQVARQVTNRGYPKAPFKLEIEEFNDEELHAHISKARQALFNHRLDVFRKRKPSKLQRYKWQYQIAVAKTLLKQREILARGELPIEADRPYKEVVAESYNRGTARAEWAARGSSITARRMPFRLLRVKRAKTLARRKAILSAKFARRNTTAQKKATGNLTREEKIKLYLDNLPKSDKKPALSGLQQRRILHVGVSKSQAASARAQRYLDGLKKRRTYFGVKDH